MNKQVKPGMIFIISTIIVMLIGVLIYSVYAADYTTSGLAGNAGSNSSTFWNAKVGETITDDIPDPPSGCNATKWWLCLQHNVVSSLEDGAKIRAIIDIDVNTVGEYTASINNGDGRTVTKDNDRNIKKLAYFIYAATVSTNTGYPASGTDAKKQLYTYIINGNIDAYIGDFADKLSYDNTYYKATIDSYANDYANSYSKGSNAEITKENDDGAKVTIRNVNGRTYSYLGPFSLKTGGSVSSVSITDGNKSATVVGYANSLDGKINPAESELPKNGNKFYIVTSSTLTSLYPTVTINTSGAASGGTIKNPVTGKILNGYIKARIIFSGKNRGQGAGIYRGDIQTSETTTDSVTLTAKNDLGKIEIVKIGAYTGNEEYESVKNMGFKLYRLDGGTKKYVRINNQNQIKNQTIVSIDYSVSYEENEKNATTLYTYNGGKISIDNISTEYKYYIEEVDTDNINYEAKLIKATMQVGDNKLVNLTVNNNTVGPIDVELKSSGGAKGKSTKVTLTDYRKTGDLLIEKVDKDTYDIKLANVKFRLLNSDTKKYVVAKKTGSGKYVIENQLKAYKETEEEATLFVTDSKGRIEIKGLDVGNYSIIEAENPNYGYVVGGLEEQYVTSTVISAGETQKEVILNQKHTGNLEIRKIDMDSRKPLENVSFKIRKRISTTEEKSEKGDINGDGYIDDQDVSLLLNYISKRVELTSGQLKRADFTGDGLVNSGDLAGLNAKVNFTYVVAMEYENTSEGSVLKELSESVGTKYLDGMKTGSSYEATVFKTDVRGYIRLYNILEGDYIIDEVDVGDMVIITMGMR